MSLTKQEIRETVRETLRALGFDVDNPLELQQDLAHLRKIRKRWERGLLAGIIAAISAFATWATTELIKRGGH